MKSSLFAAFVCGAAADAQHHIGSHVECVGSRAHLVSYDIKGDTADEVTDASVLMERDPSNDEFCADKDPSGLPAMPNFPFPPIPGPSGDKNLCFGANMDETCLHAKSSLPLIHGLFECSNCFVGVTGDLYYKFESRNLKLQSLEVGIQNAKLSGALEVHAHGDHATDITPGSISLPEIPVNINFKVGPLPVNIDISLPTHLDFSLGLKGQLDATVGATVDADLGDHFLTWTEADGFVKHNTELTVNASPTLTVDAGDSGADIGLSLASSLQINVNKMVWFHIDAGVALPQKVYIDQDTGSKSQACLKADLDIPVTHEAEVYKKVLGHDISLKHFGPVNLLHIHRDEALKKCVGLPIAAAVV